MQVEYGERLVYRDEKGNARVCLSQRDWCSGALAADRLARTMELRVKVLQGAEAQRRASEGAASSQRLWRMPGRWRATLVWGRWVPDRSSRIL